MLLPSVLDVCTRLQGFKSELSMHSKLPLALSSGALPIRRTNDLLVWRTEAPIE
jgi:hypothetical protein